MKLRRLTAASALALGATTRGAQYLEQFPGWGGYLLFLACTGAVFLAGAKCGELFKGT